MPGSLRWPISSNNSGLTTSSYELTYLFPWKLGTHVPSQIGPAVFDAGTTVKGLGASVKPKPNLAVGGCLQDASIFGRPINSLVKESVTSTRQGEFGIKT